MLSFAVGRELRGQEFCVQWFPLGLDSFNQIKAVANPNRAFHRNCYVHFAVGVGLGLGLDLLLVLLVPFALLCPFLLLILVPALASARIA